MPKWPWSSCSRKAWTARSTATGSSAVHSASVVWPLLSIRMSRLIREMLRPATNSSASAPARLHVGGAHWPRIVHGRSATDRERDVQVVLLTIPLVDGRAPVLGGHGANDEGELR